MIINKGRPDQGRKDILLVCQYFYPENNSSAILPYDTARFFVACGFKTGVLVLFITSVFLQDIC